MPIDQSAEHKSTFLLWLATAFLMIASPTLHATQVRLTTVVEGKLQPTIRGSSNLPDGMKLVLRVARQESPFQFEPLVELQFGHFEVGPLLQGSRDLNAGVVLP
jgi:hypothetical protein